MLGLFVGCYTDDEHPFGLQEIALDPSTGALTRVGEHRVENAIYLARQGNHLLCCTRGGILDWTANRFWSCGGRCLCHVAARESVYWADYLEGQVGRIAADGRITTRQHVGHGPNGARQASAHCHCAVPTPDGRSVAVCDLGTDEISFYDAEAFELQSRFRTPPGGGPRHILFHPTRPLAFVIFELAGIVASFRLSGVRLDMIGVARRIPRDYAGIDQGAAIRLSPDGRRIVVSNRGHDSLASFALSEDGALGEAVISPLPGCWPRDFLFVSETCALVALERSGTLARMEYEAATGRFAFRSELGGFHRPVALVSDADGGIRSASSRTAGGTSC